MSVHGGGGGGFQEGYIMFCFADCIDSAYFVFLGYRALRDFCNAQFLLILHIPHISYFCIVVHSGNLIARTFVYFYAADFAICN